MTSQAILSNYPNPKMRKNRHCPICGGFFKKNSDSIVHKRCLPQAKEQGLFSKGNYPHNVVFCLAEFNCECKVELHNHCKGKLKYVYPTCLFKDTCNQQSDRPPKVLLTEGDVAARTKP